METVVGKSLELVDPPSDEDAESRQLPEVLFRMRLGLMTSFDNNFV
jgi:hypothetical protein